MLLAALIPELIGLTQQVATEILPIYQAQDSALLAQKNDGSPLTQADLCAHRLIAEGLKRLTPDWPIISEESCAIPFAVRQQWQRYWLVDPIDGTKEFLAKNGDFTINIALIDQHQPILGVVAVPVSQTVYYGLQGEGAWSVQEEMVQPLAVQPYDRQKKLRVVASRSHATEAVNRLVNHYPNIELLRRGSSLKFCLIASGFADFYPRLGPTSEWDTAAGQCVLEQAGGMVVDLQGKPLRYNTQETYLNPSFLAAADNTISWQEFFDDAD